VNLNGTTAGLFASLVAVIDREAASDLEPEFGAAAEWRAWRSRAEARWQLRAELLEAAEPWRAPGELEPLFQREEFAGFLEVWRRWAPRLAPMAIMERAA
jgi:hypothetical protein